jgi:putative ABC transport system permease protein
MFGAAPLPGQKRRSITFLEIVGIVPSAKHSSLTEEPRAFLYLPFQDQYRSEMTLHARTRGSGPREMALLSASIRNQMRAIDKDLPLSGVGPMLNRMSFALAPIRIAGTILTVSGVLALILAAVGVYGIASFATVRRTREIGIRMALGAEARTLQASLMTKGMGNVLVGALIGGAMSAFVIRLLKPLLIGVSTTDPITLSVALLVLIGVALLGNYIPARQAIRIDPALALREE